MGKKRSAPQSQRPAKRHKPLPTKNKAAKATKQKGKEKAADRDVIPIPANDEDDESGLSDNDTGLVGEYGGAVSFLQNLDHKGIARSKKETQRLHQLSKPQREVHRDDDLPSVDSHSDDDDVWSTDIGSDEDDDDAALSNAGFDSEVTLDSDEEMSYEMAPRKQRIAEEDKKPRGISRLPIKLANGRLQDTGENIPAAPDEEDEVDSDESDEDDATPPPQPKREDVSTGARFGRAAVVDIISMKDRKARVAAAKDQIAGICQDIMAEPENSLGLLRRLHTFSLPEISTPAHPDPVPNDILIRKLTILSQLAVFKDIVPGYRIRPLTDAEKAEKVSQMVARTREWEQGLLSVYQAYLKSLDTEIRAKSELADVALNCMCTLLTDVTHFNFRVNLMNCIVARLSRKSRDESFDRCLDALISVFREDLTGAASLEIVRLLNRMIKERKYQVRLEVLGCLLHLRLKTELGVRASDSKADKASAEPVKSKGKQKKGKPGAKPHLSKKARKVLKERKEIEKEFHEAEAEVDKEERATTQTETLKLLFVLYFSILKHPTPTPLLPAALEGISKFAHLVNVDFFRDLMKVLKGLVSLEVEDLSEQEIIGHRLRCIVTAFDLLSGQGEALSIDLADFVTQLYALIPRLSLIATIDDTSLSSARRAPSASPNDPHHPPQKQKQKQKQQSQKQEDQDSTVSALLFRALAVVFSPRTLGGSGKPPAWRAAAFAKRLLSAALHWPAPSAVRALELVRGLLAKDPRLRVLLGTTADRAADGVYRPDVDDPQLCNALGTAFWELYALRDAHWERAVREEARRVIDVGEEP